MEPPAASGPAEIGEVLGGYRLLSVLGQGGMGCVYQAVHERLGRTAAVKVLAAELAGDASFVSRFFQEARLVNEIRHPNIIDIVDFVETTEPRRVAYVMELLPGASLKAVLEAGRLQLPQAVNACYQLANALQAVHARGAVHRDLKPDNIFVVAPLESDLGQVPSVKILDFGIAKSESGGAQHRTRTGMILGTPTYMAPEQITAEPVSAGTDVYALAEIFYEMVSGQKIFVAPDAPGVLRAKLIGDPGPLPLPDGTGAPEEIRALVTACLANRPEDRPTTEAVKAQLLKILEKSATAPAGAPAPIASLFAATLVPTAGVASGTAPLPRPTQGRPSSGRKLALGVGAGVALMAGLVVLSVATSPRSEPEVEALVVEHDPDEDVDDEAPVPDPREARTSARPSRPRAEKKDAPPARTVTEPKLDSQGSSPRPRRRNSGGIMGELEDIEAALGDAADRIGSDLEIDNAQGLAERGDQALRGKNFARAKRLYQQCLQKRQLAVCHRGLGHVYLAERDRNRANEHFGRYLELAPEAADAAKIAKLMTQP